MSKKYWIYKGQKMPVKKGRLKVEKDSDKLFNELVRKTGQANKRLRQIRNEFGSLGWAGGKLREKTSFHLVNTWRGSKGIKVSKSMSEEQMKITLKAINDFLKSETSTVKGVKKVMQKQQQTLRLNFSRPDKEITKEESQTLYSFFVDKDFSYVLLYADLDPSELYALLLDAKESGDSQEQWIKRVENYIQKTVDDNLKEALINLYNDWMY